MAFVDITDVRTTARQKLTPNRRLKIWERAAGVCVLCNRKIDGVHERWKRQKIRCIVAEASKRPLPFGGASRWKRTLPGKIVPR